MDDTSEYARVRLGATVSEGSSHELDRILEAENKPRRWVVWIALVWVLVSLISLLRGGKAGAASVAGVAACSVAYWTLTLISFPLMGLVTWIVGRSLVKSDARKLELGYKGDIVWDRRTAVTHPLIAAFAGTIGGMLGVGGGMIMGPLLLEFGMTPAATTATSATTVFLTASSAAFQFFALGQMEWDYSVWYGCLSFLATLIGQLAINHAVRKYNRASLVVLCMLLVMVVATGMMVMAGVVSVQKDLSLGRSMGFKPLC